MFMQMKKLSTILTAVSGLSALNARADISTRLSDTIKQGTGSINLLKDISGAQLAQQVSPSGNLYFGVDVNENASGNEMAASEGVALKSVQLTVTTTAGTYTFSNFTTNTSAVLSQAGSPTLGTYYTLFGQAGSSQLTSGSTGFSLSAFDDVLVLNNVSFTGTVISAQMNVQFLDTGNSKAANDTFFDFSGGYEDLALLSTQDAYVLDTANIGVADRPTSVTASILSPTVTAEEVAAATATTPTATPVETTPPPAITTENVATPSAAPAAPAPGMVALLMMCGMALAAKILHTPAKGSRRA